MLSLETSPNSQNSGNHLTRGKLVARKKIKARKTVDRILENTDKATYVKNLVERKIERLVADFMRYKTLLIKALGKDAEEAGEFLRRGRVKRLQNLLDATNKRLMDNNKEPIPAEGIHSCIQLADAFRELRDLPWPDRRILYVSLAKIQGDVLEIPELSGINLHKLLLDVTVDIQDRPALDRDYEVIDESVQLFRDEFADLTPEAKKLGEILKNGETITIDQKLFGTIALAIKEFHKKYSRGNGEASLTAITPGAIREFKCIQCDGSSKMAASIIRKLGGEAYTLHLPGHVIVLTKDVKGEWWLFDPVNDAFESIPQARVEIIPGKRIGLVQIPKCIFGMSRTFPKNTIAPFFVSLHDANSSLISGNYESIQEGVSNPANRKYQSAIAAKPFYDTPEQQTIIQGSKNMPEKLRTRLLIDLAYAQVIIERHPSRPTPETHKSLFVALDDIKREMQEFETHPQGEQENRFGILLAKAIAKLGDAHTNLNLMDDSSPMLPLIFRILDNRVFVAGVIEDSNEATKGLLGKEITTVNGIPVANLFETFSLLEGNENRYSSRWSIQGLLMAEKIYEGLGYSDNPGSFELGYRDKNIDGEQNLVVSTKRLDKQPNYKTMGLLTRERKNKKIPFQVEFDERCGAIIFEYDRCIRHPENTKDEEDRALYMDFKDKMNSLFEQIDEKDPKKLIVDLRFNAGGDSQSFHKGFMLRLKQSKFFRNGGRLVILISNRTFSSGTLAIKELIEADLERSNIDIKKQLGLSDETSWGELHDIIRERGFRSYQEIFEAIGYNNRGFVILGEPSGGAPDHFGNVPVRYELPHTKTQLSCSTKYFRGVGNTYLPDIHIEPTSEEYFSGKDIVLEKALEF